MNNFHFYTMMNEIISLNKVLSEDRKTGYVLLKLLCFHKKNHKNTDVAFGIWEIQV